MTIHSEDYSENLVYPPRPPRPRDHSRPDVSPLSEEVEELCAHSLALCLVSFGLVSSATEDEDLEAMCRVFVQAETFTFMRFNSLPAYDDVTRVRILTDKGCGNVPLWEINQVMQSVGKSPFASLSKIKGAILTDVRMLLVDTPTYDYIGDDYDRAAEVIQDIWTFWLGGGTQEALSALNKS